MVLWLFPSSAGYPGRRVVKVHAYKYQTASDEEVTVRIRKICLRSVFGRVWYDCPCETNSFAQSGFHAWAVDLFLKCW